MKVKCCNFVGEHSAAFGGCQVQREAREARRYRISHDGSYTEAVSQIGGTKVQNDGASMAAPVLSGPNVRTGIAASPGMVLRPVQKS